MKKSTIAGSVSGVVITSNKSQNTRGLKKCVPQKCFLKSSDLPSIIIPIGIPEVLEVIRVPGLRKFFDLLKNFSFNIQQTTTSMTQSQLAISFMLSSKFPVEILEAKALYNGAGLELTAVFKELSTILFLKVLLSTVSPLDCSSGLNSLGLMSNNKTCKHLCLQNGKLCGFP